MPTTARLEIPTPAGDSGNNIPSDLQELAAAVDAAAARWLPDCLYAAIPGAAAAYERCLVYATDARAVFRCDGAAWTPIAEIVSMTTVQRDALVAGGTWTGRVIWNSTLGQQQRWTGAAWAAVASASLIIDLEHSATQSTSNATFAAVQFDTEIADPDGYHSGAANTRVTCPDAYLGRNHLVIGNIEFQASATGERHLYVKLNGGTFVKKISLGNAGGSSSTNIEVTYDWLPTTSGDFLELYAYQTSGGALNINSGSATPISNHLQIVRLA